MRKRPVRVGRWVARMRHAAAQLLVLGLLGCGGAPQHAPTTSGPKSQRESTPYRELVVSPDAQTLELDCDRSAFEECNAIDDDCNGVIDDMCGYESGRVQITVSWNTGADIDLYVTDPSGATLFYNEEHKRSRIGGHLDHDARGDCRREQQNPRVENAYWPSPESGPYKVELHYFSTCAQAATTEVTLSVVVERELLGTYRYRLEPQQRIEALRFVKR